MGGQRWLEAAPSSRRWTWAAELVALTAGTNALDTFGQQPTGVGSRWPRAQWLVTVGKGIIKRPEAARAIWGHR